MHHNLRANALIFHGLAVAAVARITLGCEDDQRCKSGHGANKEVFLTLAYCPPPFGGVIIMWEPGVPGNISRGPPSLNVAEIPVVCGVALGV